VKKVAYGQVEEGGLRPGKRCPSGRLKKVAYGQVKKEAYGQVEEGGLRPGKRCPSGR
jgi:methylphosphotriester-DNA--protein-cysteine methyltransferase